MAKLSLTTIASRYGSIEALNANFDAIELALENTLSRDGTSPNVMEASLDMDSNRILNLPTPTTSGEPIPLSWAVANYSNFQTVAGLSTEIDVLAALNTEIAALYPIRTDISDVAAVASSVPTVAGIAANVSTVAGAVSNINIVAPYVSDINTVATNIEDVTNFAGVYYGSAASAPSARQDGSALQAADLYFNTTDNNMYVYTGSAWATVSNTASSSSAATSAAAASGSASDAATSAGEALTSENNAATSESNAALSATAASNAQTAAETAQTAAEAAQEAIDGLYLGAQASDPSVDLNGNALTAGDWYYNTTSNIVRIYDGSVWKNGSVDGDLFLRVANNLNDLNNASTARTNLGLAIGTDVQAYSSVLANTTASFTTADETKLDGIESGATADQTATEIKTAYESNSDTNAFTDNLKTKLEGIETDADVTDADNVNSAGAVMNSDTSTTDMLFVVDEDNMASNSDTKVPTQQSVKAYVDNATAAALHYHDPVRVESPSALSADYNNGTDGVGATLTNNSTQAALSIDGVALSLDDRVLIYNQATAAHNGVYKVTTVGDESTNWVLTRTDDADSYNPSDPDSLGAGDSFYVQEGNTGAGESYVLTTAGAITFGTTGLTFSQFSATPQYTGGTGITVTGQSIALSDEQFTSTLKTKLDGIETAADVTDATNVAAAGAAMDGDFTSEGLMKRGSSEGSYSIVTDGSADWNTAYGWGNHASAGYLTSETSHADVVVDGDFGSQGLMARGATAGSYSIVTDNSSDWNTAYGWGNHADAGYLTTETYTGTVTSVGATVPTGLTVSGSPITSSGTLAISYDTGYSIPTTSSQSNWDSAYSWGDHSSGGYLTSITGVTKTSATGSGVLPSGTTAQRDASPSAGYLRFNTSSTSFEGYNGTAWGAIGGSGGGGTYNSYTANATLVAYETALADTSGGAFTLTLPATPSDGDVIVVADATGNFSTNNLTIARNGETIQGSATDLVCDIDNIALRLHYNGSDWRVYAILGASAGNVVTLTGTQTLTNKTLTTPTVTNPTINNYTEGSVSIGTVSSSHTFSLTNGTVQNATLTASTACTFTMPTATAGKSFILILKQPSATGNATATFTGVLWSGGIAPTITAAAGSVDMFTFVADGTSWYGAKAQDFS